MALTDSNLSNIHVNANPASSICRSESFSYWHMEMEYSSMMMEKRQLFLRSYHFCRKRSLAERIRSSLVRVKRVLWFRLRSAVKLRRLVLSKLRFTFHRRRRFVRLMNNHHRHAHKYTSCFL